MRFSERGLGTVCGPVALANYFGGIFRRIALPRLHSANICLKDNTPDTVTRPDTPSGFFSTRNVSVCGAVICGYVAMARSNPQVLHTPLNTAADIYAHAIHNLMNSASWDGPLATLTSSRRQVMRVRRSGECQSLGLRY